MKPKERKVNCANSMKTKGREERGFTMARV